MERTPDSSRIISLDILRGIALFGMIIVHFHQTMEIPADGVEDVVGWVVWMGLETKAWATFAFLFGAGFAILIGRAEARGLNVTALFLRRMLGLAIFGIAVQLLFGFRILLDYALWGIPLLLVRKWSTGSLLVIAFVAAIAPTVYSRFEAGAAKERREIAAQVHEANAHGTFAEAVRARAVDARLDVFAASNSRSRQQLRFVHFRTHRDSPWNFSRSQAQKERDSGDDVVRLCFLGGVLDWNLEVRDGDRVRYRQ
jgi:Predicted membrane protein